MKLEKSCADCERSLSPTFDLNVENSSIASDAAAKNYLEESSLNLKVKVEPDASQPDAIVGEPWIDPVSTTATESNHSNSSPEAISNKETIPEPSTSLPTSTLTSPAQKSRPMLLHNAQSVIPGVSTSSPNMTDPTQFLVQPRINPPRYMHNSHKHSWVQRQKEVKKILKQRTQEWKEKQSLYQLMRSAATTHKSLLGYRKQDPVLFARERGIHPTGTDAVPRTAFSWYPGFMAPTELPHIRSYPIPNYPIMTDYNPKFVPNSAPLLKRRYSTEISSAGEKKSSSEGLVTGGHHDPLIEEVVSLADNKSSYVEDRNSAGHRRSKRARKSIDEPPSAERRESVDSGNSETDGDNLSSGKYISDFAETFQNTPEDHQVAHINGLLSLPSSRETRYGITYGELKRRCGGPEYLTRVDLVAYVRHSKSSGRSLLDKYKIVSANRASRPTIMSKMCENEARVLGDGILRMNMNYFPDKMLAKVATESLREGVEEDEQDGDKDEKIKSKIQEKMQNIETTRSMLKEVFDLLQSEKDQEEMHRFELASHTFGTANLKNHLTLFDRFFQEYQNSLMVSVDKSGSASE